MPTFFLHSCGNITDIVADIVELGFHILHPIQPECMDPAAVKARWGGQIVACATLGAQRTLSLSSPADVRRETTRLMDTIGADRRCIVCPSNRVQPETPWENVLAFSSAARSHRFGRRNSGRGGSPRVVTPRNTCLPFTKVMLTANCPSMIAMSASLPTLMLPVSRSIPSVVAGLRLTQRTASSRGRPYTRAASAARGSG